MIAAPQQLELSADEAAVLSAYLRADRPLMQLLEELNLRLDEFLDWLESDLIQSLIQRYLAAAQLQAQLRAAGAAPAAVESLQATLTADTTPAERRRAASALLRAARPAKPPPRRALPQDTSQIAAHSLAPADDPAQQPPNAEPSDADAPAHTVPPRAASIPSARPRRADAGPAADADPSLRSASLASPSPRIGSPAPCESGQPCG